jgi:predicted helicase
MSASIGDIDRYAKLNGFVHYKPIRISSNFKFENSGIVRICRHNLAAKHKAQNIGDAINKGIIKDYKIIVTKISAEIKDEHDYYSILSECILKVMNEKKLKKALLFNSTIKDSEKIKNYVNYKKEISENNFEAFHVDGYLDIKTRKEIIYKLSNEDEKTIVTNAKLFSEGIDIPAIELIGFLNRTKSIVDIAQRVGRVQRKRFEDDNEPGYIFIPLFEDKNSNISDFYSGDWDYLVDVMLAFKEMDNRVNASFYNMFSNNNNYKEFLKQVEIINFNKNNNIDKYFSSKRPRPNILWV